MFAHLNFISELQTCFCNFNSVLFPAMKVIHLMFVVIAMSTVGAKILDEQMQNLNGLVPTESITITELKDKVELAELPLKSANPCFYADIDAVCLNKTGSEVKPSCECEQHPDNERAIVCCNVTDITKAISCAVQNTSTYSSIHIINAVQAEVNVSHMNLLKHFDSLMITDGNITKIIGQFSKFTAIKCLNFSNNNISEISERALFNLNQLQILDLSTNNLTKLPSLTKVSTIDIRGNKKISCKNVLSAIDRGVAFSYKNVSFCERETVYNWFNSTAFISIQTVENMKQLKDNCPTNCTCEPDQMLFDQIEVDDNSLVFKAKIDCSSRGLTELPSKLPENTLTLNISNNSISSLKELVSNPYYQNIRSLFADDNLIKSVEELEGSKFLENFTKLSLKNNKIKNIPLYMLSNLEKNLNGKLVYLGGNRINCECSTIKNQRVSLRTKILEISF